MFFCCVDTHVLEYTCEVQCPLTLQTFRLWKFALMKIINHVQLWLGFVIILNLDVNFTSTETSDNYLKKLNTNSAKTIFIRYNYLLKSLDHIGAHVGDVARYVVGRRLTYCRVLALGETLYLMNVFSGPYFKLSINNVILSHISGLLLKNSL